MSAGGSNGPEFGWSLRMAWRDSRGQRRILLLFMLCVAAGIGALVAVASLRDNLDGVIEQQSRSLLGADLEIGGRQPFSDRMEAFFRRLGGTTAREVRMRTMAVFPASGESRFVQVRALEGAFPFYGETETDPGNRLPFGGMAGRYDSAALPPVVVEQSLMLQMGFSVGDTVQLGNRAFVIDAALLRVAGESELGGFFAPRLYIPLAALAETGLTDAGSIARYKMYFEFEGGLGLERQAILDEARAELFIEEGIEVTTVESRQRNLRRVMDNLFDFLNLIGFIALVLGGIGVGGAVQVYMREKLSTIALMRCLGASNWMTFKVYLWQIVVIGLLGSLLGSTVGVGSQFLLPVFLAEFLPFPLEVQVSVRSILAGLSFGWVVAVLFALLPLLRVREVSPLGALRAAVDVPPRRWPGLGSIFVVVLLGALLVGFALLQTRKISYGLAFCGGLISAYLLLAGLSVFLRWLLKRFAPANAPYSLRLALSSMYRPGNRTVFLMVTLGMGAFLLNTLYLTRASLLDQVRLTGAEDAANVILLDVQEDQVDALRQVLDTNDYLTRDVLPIVTMRIAGMRGKTLAEWRRDPDAGIRRWVYTWEFRASYRDQLLDNEKVIAGAFTPVHDSTEPIPVSLSENIREDFNIQIGEEIIWDVQGVPLRTVVDSIRDVEWTPGRQNFTVVFPQGSLDEAPKVYIVTVQVADRAAAANLQRLMGQGFTNVSLLDLTLIFETFRTVLDRASFVIQFMAGFTILTGLVVLLCAIYTSRYQRARESVLLRALGAPASLVRRVMSIEYIMLGLLGGLAGVLLSSVAAFALQTFIFKVPFTWNGLDALLTILFTGLLTWITGMLNSRHLVAQPPLQILRED